MKRILLAAFLGTWGTQVHADVIYQQPPDPNGGFYRSSWWDPDGSNYDEYVWDRFVLDNDAEVDSVGWRGAYDPAFGGSSPVVNFTVAIYASIIGGSEPDLAHPPLVEYQTDSNAGEAYAGVFGSATMYDYRFALPVAFHAQAGVPYWVQIEGWQWGFPGWSIARSTGGDGHHFRCQHLTDGFDGGPPTGCWFTAPSGDAAFMLLSTTVVSVDAPPIATDFALRGALPNPSRGDRVEMSFNLPNAAPAELALFDVAGRQVAFQEVGALGAGPHVVDLAGRTAIPPGIYLARLSQGTRSQTVKVVIMR